MNGSSSPLESTLKSSGNLDYLLKTWVNIYLLLPECLTNGSQIKVKELLFSLSVFYSGVILSKNCASSPISANSA